MGPALAAVGAVFAALIELTIASRFQIADAQLHILLIFAVVLTLVVGFEDGMAWAFAGGLTVDLLAMRPLGSTVFALLVAVGAAAVLGRVLARSRAIGPVAGVFLLTVVYSVVSFMVTASLQHSGAAPGWRSLVIDAAFNALASVPVVAVFVAIRRRTDSKERVVW